MTTHGSVAKSVRLRKEQHPEHYCSAPGCLWRTRHTGTDAAGQPMERITPCPKHSKPVTSVCRACDGEGYNPEYKYSDTPMEPKRCGYCLGTGKVRA